MGLFLLGGRRGARAGSPPADPPDVGLRIGPARCGFSFCWGPAWVDEGELPAGEAPLQVTGYIAQWLERLTADQQVPGSNPGVPLAAPRGVCVC